MHFRNHLCVSRKQSMSHKCATFAARHRIMNNHLKIANRGMSNAFARALGIGATVKRVVCKIPLLARALGR